jgi:hypothetical protein
MREPNEADDAEEAPPPEYDTLPDPSTLTPFAQRQELLGRFIDSAEILDSGLAVAAAARARAIDELREVSEEIAAQEQVEDSARPPELRANQGQESGWSIRNRARAELTTEIAVAFLVSKSAARLLIEESATLVADLPLTLDALETGSIRYEHARLMASTAWALPQPARAGFEEEALPWAKSLILSAFRTKLLALREKHHTETMRERHEKAAVCRTLTLEPGEDGVGFLTLRDANETLSAIYNRMTDMALPKAKDDPRTLAQRRLDTATEILLGGDLCTRESSARESSASESSRRGRPLGQASPRRCTSPSPCSPCSARTTPRPPSTAPSPSTRSPPAPSSPEHPASTGCSPTRSPEALSPSTTPTATSPSPFAGPCNSSTPPAPDRGAPPPPLKQTDTTPRNGQPATTPHCRTPHCSAPSTTNSSTTPAGR